MVLKHLVHSYELDSNETPSNRPQCDLDTTSLRPWSDLDAFFMSAKLGAPLTTFRGCRSPLFVFLRDDPQQNCVKLSTPVSDLVFKALSDDTIHFALYGSSLNHNLIGWNNSNSQSESFVLVVLKAAMERKKKGTIWKSNENWVRNWCQKWHTILFTATNQENKQNCRY